MTNDGKPYGPFRFKEIVKEIYAITKNTSTSYTEVLQMTPLERRYVLDCLVEESNRIKEKLEKAKEESTNKKINKR